jgi:hypothetical protein
MHSRRYVLILLPLLAIACGFGASLLPGVTPSPTANAPGIATVIPANVVGNAATPTAIAHPQGWVLSQDASGTCQVATPPGWQLGRDFFLAAEKTNPGHFVNRPGQFPPIGAALWTNNKETQPPDSKLFQIRTSLVNGERVCSVWRIKESTDFTAAEKSEMDQVGKTLQVVR